MRTSLNTRECCGAYSFILSTVGLRSGVCGMSPQFFCIRNEAFHVPDLVAELSQLGLIDRVEFEFLFWLNEDASVEAAAPEDDGDMDVRVLVQDVLCTVG